MDQISAPGGFLGEFLLTGILLPIVASFVLDGIVLWFRGRSPRVLLISATFTVAIIVLSWGAWQNGVNASESAISLPDDMSGATQLVLLFSVPAALIGFGLRMLALFLNPATRAADQAAIAERRGRREMKVLRRTAPPVGAPANIDVRPGVARHAA